MSLDSSAPRPDVPSLVPQLSDLGELRDFESAGQAVLKFLRARFGFSLWMLTRTQGEDWIVLQAEDDRYGVETGTVMPWADSFCARMVNGDGPRVAPRSMRVAAYREAPIARTLPIGAYVGVPLTRADGALFGTLCAIDPSPQPDAISEEQPMLELLAGLLAIVLDRELQALEQKRRLERLELESQTDGVTGLFNRRGWDRLRALEEDRCRRYGQAASILVIDLDRLKETNDRDGHHAGDALIVRAAQTLRAVARSHDVVARLGGDEFALLAAECDAAGAEALRERLAAALAAAGVEASLGVATRAPGLGLDGAWRLADRRMYAAKAGR